ncbi:universal stress protein [Desulfosarcina sp. OttesenSCG-928-A07]|nr:universal stress protein [Desulfosarcina sp. OttesenSCG-928-G17]MDL2329887.1 universal stress protein [Desulfosarcina sp. OttesenSCG-928-A07]
MFRHILAATDVITQPDAPILSAVELLRQQGGHLVILHVIIPETPSPSPQTHHFATGAPVALDNAYMSEVAQALRYTYAPLLSNLSFRIHVAAGVPWQAILETAAMADADLIVLGNRSVETATQGKERIIGKVGTTVAHVVTRETCPVMVVNRPATPEQMRFGRIMVSVDFSRTCECAVCFAARLAVLHHSQVTVFHMLPVPPYPKYTPADYAADMENAQKRLADFCDPYLDGIDHTYQIQAGALPHLAIVAAADQTRTDLIIMGSHTRDQAGKWYPGSAVERTSYRAACPIMVINDPELLVQNGKNEDRLIHLFTHSSN